MQNYVLDLLYSFAIYCLGLYGLDIYAILYGYIIQHRKKCGVVFMIATYISVTLAYLLCKLWLK